MWHFGKLHYSAADTRHGITRHTLVCHELCGFNAAEWVCAVLRSAVSFWVSGYLLSACWHCSAPLSSVECCGYLLFACQVIAVLLAIWYQ